MVYSHESEDAMFVGLRTRQFPQMPPGYFEAEQSVGSMSPLASYFCIPETLFLIIVHFRREVLANFPTGALLTLRDKGKTNHSAFTQVLSVSDPD